MDDNNFWINNNGKKEQLRETKHGVRKEQVDKKFHNLFDAYDINQDGTLESDELKEISSFFKMSAGEDNMLDATENKNVASIFSNQANIENADFMGFVKSVSDATGEIISTTAKQSSDGGKEIITKYKDGTIETIVYYSNGDFKYKKIEKVFTETKYEIIIDGEKKELTEVQYKQAIAKLKEQSKQNVSNTSLKVGERKNNNKISGLNLTPDIKVNTTTETRTEKKEIYSPRYILENMGIDANSDDGKKILERMQCLPEESLEQLKDGKEIKELLTTNELEGTFDNLSNVLEIIYGVTLRNDEEYKATEKQREELITQIKAVNLLSNLYETIATYCDQYTDSQGLFGLSSEGVGYILNKLGLDGENHYQWAETCRENSQKLQGFKMLNPAKFKEEFKAFRNIDFNMDSFKEIISMTETGKSVDENGQLTDEFKTLVRNACNMGKYDIDNPNDSTFNQVMNGFGEALLMIMTFGWGVEAKGGQMLATATVGTFSKLGVEIASKQVKNKLLQGALRLSGQTVKLIGPMLNEGTKMAVYTIATGTATNISNRIIKQDSEDNTLEKLVQTELQVIDNAKGSFAFGAFAGAYGSTVTQKVMQSAQKVSSKVATAISNKLAHGPMDAGEVYATILKESSPKAIGEVAAFASDIIGFTGFESALAIYNVKNNKKNYPNGITIGDLTQLLWAEFKNQGYSLGQMKSISYLIMMLTGSRSARMQSMEYMKDNIPALKSAKIEQNAKGYSIKLADGRSIECKNATEMVAALNLMVRNETAFSSKFDVKTKTEEMTSEGSITTKTAKVIQNEDSRRIDSSNINEPTNTIEGLKSEEINTKLQKLQKKYDSYELLINSKTLLEKFDYENADIHLKHLEILLNNDTNRLSSIINNGYFSSKEGAEALEFILNHFEQQPPLGRISDVDYVLAELDVNSATNMINRKLYNITDASKRTLLAKLTDEEYNRYLNSPLNKDLNYVSKNDDVNNLLLNMKGIGNIDSYRKLDNELTKLLDDPSRNKEETLKMINHLISNYSDEKSYYLVQILSDGNFLATYEKAYKYVVQHGYTDSKIAIADPNTSNIYNSGDIYDDFLGEYKKTSWDVIVFDEQGNFIRRSQADNSSIEVDESIASSKNNQQFKAETKDGKYDKKLLLQSNKNVYDNNGNLLYTESYVKSKDVDGKYDIYREYPNGKRYKIGLAEETKAGDIVIEKTLTSDTGIITNYVYMESTNGSRYNYTKVVNNEGKVLVENKQRFKVLNEHHFESYENGVKYDIQYQIGEQGIIDIKVKKDNGESVTVTMGGNALDSNGILSNDLSTMLKQMPGSFYFDIVKGGLKKVGKEIDNVQSDNAHFNDSKNIIAISKEWSNDLFTFCHEFGHYRDYFKHISDNSEVVEIYMKERNNFINNNSQFEANQMNYFINSYTRRTESIEGSISEIVAEINAILYSSNANPQLELRSQYLQQYFPETYAKVAELLMDTKSDTTIETKQSIEVDNNKVNNRLYATESTVTRTNQKMQNSEESQSETKISDVTINANSQISKQSENLGLWGRLVGKIKNRKIDVVEICKDNKGNVNKNIYNEVSNFVKAAQDKGVKTYDIQSLLNTLKKENGEINTEELRLYNEILNIIPADDLHMFENVCLVNSKRDINLLNLATNLLKNGENMYDVQTLCNKIATTENGNISPIIDFVMSLIKDKNNISAIIQLLHSCEMNDIYDERSVNTIRLDNIQYAKELLQDKCDIHSAINIVSDCKNYYEQKLDLVKKQAFNDLKESGIAYRNLSDILELCYSNDKIYDVNNQESIVEYFKGKVISQEVLAFVKDMKQNKYSDENILNILASINDDIFLFRHINNDKFTEMKSTLQKIESLCKQNNINDIDIRNNIIDSYVKLVSIEDVKDLNLSEKLELYAELTSLDNLAKNMIKTLGINVDETIASLSTMIGTKRKAIVMQKNKQSDFVHNILANNNENADNILKTFDFTQYEKEGLPLEYSRDKFTENIKQLLSELSENERNIVMKHFGFVDGINGYEGLLNNNPISTQGLSTRAIEVSEKILTEIEDFTINNKVNTGNKEVDSVLTSLIQGCPEFATVIGKKQHETHKYSVDIHTLKVLQNAMNNPLYDKLSDVDKMILKISTLLHDLGKKGEVVDKGHAELSGEYAIAILDNLSLPQKVKDRILDIVDNHHWFEDYNKGNTTAEDVATRCRRPEDLYIYQILAKADLESVNDNFHLKCTKTTTQAEYNNYMSEKMEAITDAVNKIYQKSNLIFDTQFVKNGELFPTQTVEIDGVQTDLKVLNLNEIDDDTNLTQYGFQPNVMKSDIRLMVHMTDPKKETMDPVMMLTTNSLNQSTWSTSLISTENNRTYLNREFGFILDVDQANISHAYYANISSGNAKDIDSFKQFLFDTNNEYRTYVRDNMIKELNNKGYDITEDDYATLSKVLVQKKYLTQIKSNEIFKVGNNQIKGSDLIECLKLSRDALFNGGNIHSEIVPINPRVKGLIAKVDKIEDCPTEFLQFAKDHNLPIIIMKKSNPE